MLDHRPPARHPAARAFRHGRARAVAVALIGAIVIVLAAARRADAGSYVVTECSPTSAAYDATAERSTDHYRFRVRCEGAGEGLEVYHDAADTEPGNYGAWVWRAPAGTVFTNVQANASLTSQAGHHAELVVERPGGEQIPFGSEHGDFRVDSISGAFTRFQAWLRCASAGPGRQCGRAGGDGAHAYLRGIFIRTDDRAAPSLRLAGGSVLDGEVIRGLRGLVFDAADTGGGIRKVWVEADAATLVTDIRNCAVAAGFATALSPCPATTTEVAAVPTAGAGFTTGPNVLTACVEDLALDGAPNRACKSRRVWVDNVCPGSAVAGGRALAAGFGDALAVAGTVASDARGLVRGRLAGVGAGATVCALTRTLLDDQPVVVAATATTGPDGRFVIELPSGPSREVFVHYAFGDSVLARHGLVLRSAARPSLKVAPRRGLRNHDRLHFSGALPGPRCLGRVVKVQARIGRRRWQVFRTDRANGGCRFRARYKLRFTRHASHYRFRALVPQQRGYPFERGRSRTVKVKLRRPR